MEEVTCRNSLSRKRSRRISSGSIRFPVGSTNGRHILVQCFCSSGARLWALNLLFSPRLKPSKKGHQFKPEVRQALRRLNSTLLQFRSWLRAETDSSSLLTRLAVSHRQLMVSLSSTRSEDFDDGDLQRNTRRTLQQSHATRVRNKSDRATSPARRGSDANHDNLSGDGRTLP